MLIVDVVLSPREAIEQSHTRVARSRIEMLDVAVVIDVLRMTTNAVSLFSNGITELVVVKELGEAKQVAIGSGALLLGERGGMPPDGFDGGNSPTENGTRDYAGRRAVLCTTNGSGLVERCAEAKHLMLGSIVNARAVAKEALRLASSQITLVCAGSMGTLALDDVIAAGCIVRELKTLSEEFAFEDSAQLALLAATEDESLYRLLGRTHHARRLKQLGLGEDVAYAAKLNSSDLVPIRTQGEPYLAFSALRQAGGSVTTTA